MWAVRGLRDVPRELTDLPDSSAPERKYKKDRFEKELTAFDERIVKFAGQPALVKDLETIREELKKQQGVFAQFVRKEEERLLTVRRVQNSFKADIDAADRFTDRSHKISIYEGLVKAIKSASKPEKDGGFTGVTPDDLAGLLLRVQNSLHAAQGDELAEELRNIIEEDRDIKPVKEVLAEITKFVQKLERDSTHGELLGQAQEFMQAIKKESEEKDTMKQRYARLVLHTAVKATTFFAEAFNADNDLETQNKNLIEALKILREGIFDDEGSIDLRKIEALRRHFGQSTDPLHPEYIAPDPIRMKYLELVIANPHKVVTMQNIDDFTKDQTAAVRDKRTPEKKYEELLAKRSDCIDVPDAGLRLEKLDSLMAEVKSAISQDKKFATQYGEELVSSINKARDRTNIILQDDFKNRPESELKGGKPVEQLLDEKFPGNPYHSTVKQQSKLFRNSLLVILALAGGTLAYRERSRFLPKEDPSTTAAIPNPSSTGTSPVASITSSTSPENVEKNRRDALARLSATLDQRLNRHQLTLEQCRSSRSSWEAEPESNERTEAIAIWRDTHERRLIILVKIKEVIRRLEAGEMVPASEVRTIIGNGPEDSVLTDLVRDLEPLTR